MALPQAVQDELDKAAAIEAQLHGAQVVEEETEPNPPDEQTVTTPETEAPAASTPATPPEPEPQRDSGWEQKYRTLQLKYDNEVPRYAAELRELRHQVQALSDELQAARAKPTPPAEPDVTTVSEQDREAFGDDLVNLQERIARSVAAPLERHIQELTQRLSKYETTAESVVTQQAATAEDRYFERLAVAVPDWEQVNSDPNWVDWLSGRYPGAGMSRQEQLNQARERLDLNATVEMFKAFEELTQPRKQANQNQELNRQVAPPKSRAPSTPVQDQSTRIWTQAEVAAAMDPRKLRGMTPEAVERVMSEIDAAAAEGRIR
jgi:hypothetical protein